MVEDENSLRYARLGNPIYRKMLLLRFATPPEPLPIDGGLVHRYLVNGLLNFDALKCEGKGEFNMQSNLVNLTYQIELGPGEKLKLPQTLVDTIGPGSWVITIRPTEPPHKTQSSRDHSAFLNSYAPEDEGLYDDDSTW